MYILVAQKTKPFHDSRGHCQNPLYIQYNPMQMIKIQLITGGHLSLSYRFVCYFMLRRKRQEKLNFPTLLEFYPHSCLCSIFQQVPKSFLHNTCHNNGSKSESMQNGSVGKHKGTSSQAEFIITKCTQKHIQEKKQIKNGNMFQALLRL